MKPKLHPYFLYYQKKLYLFVVNSLSRINVVSLEVIEVFRF